jgi:hypothetical protein
MTAPRDWDKEMAEIDKLMAQPQAPQLPAKAGAAPAPSRPSAGAAPPVAAGAPVSRKAIFATWLKVILAAVAAGAMTQWPYAHACGVGLFLYLGAAGVIALSGVTSAISTWKRRIGLAHTVSILVLLWGLGLAAAVVLPRIGYAKAAATWFCP